jgi:hypothetical protein
MVQAMRSRLRNREVSERKQVGDAESMVTEKMKGGALDEEHL